MTRAEVARLLAAVQAGDRRTVGEADVVLWHAVMGDTVPLEFALQAVVAHFRERPGVWLEPGYIVSRWRDHRRDHLAREDDAMREARQAALDARLVGVDELAAALSIPAGDEPVRFAPQKPNPALAVPCPWCNAKAGSGCVVPKVRTPMSGFHPSRTEAGTATKKESSK